MRRPRRWRECSTAIRRFPPAGLIMHAPSSSPIAPRRPSWRQPDMEHSQPMRIGIAADHGGFHLKQTLVARLRKAGYETVDFGAHELNDGDDYPDFGIPLARAVAAGE